MVIERVRLCLFLGFSLVLAASGCAHRMGSQSTAGAISEINRHVEPEPGQTAAETVARRATEGIIDELNQPEQTRADRGRGDQRRRRVSRGA